MEDAKAVLQDRIIYLTGQITLMQLEEGILQVTKQNILKVWANEIKELKAAQTILSNHE